MAWTCSRQQPRKIIKFWSSDKLQGIILNLVKPVQTDQALQIFMQEPYYFKLKATYQSTTDRLPLSVSNYLNLIQIICLKWIIFISSINSLLCNVVWKLMTLLLNFEITQITDRENILIENKSLTKNCQMATLLSVCLHFLQIELSFNEQL